jgi:transposase
VAQASRRAVGAGSPRRTRHARLNLREGASLRARRQRGAKAQAIGVSRGGQTSKIHAVCDLLGRPVALALTAGHVSDIRAADLLTAEATRFRRLVADKGYDADRFRKTLRQAGTTPIIPGRVNRKRRIRHDERRYRDRWLIEAMFCRLKDFRRVATRYDKLAANFLSAAALAAVVAFWL